MSGNKELMALELIERGKRLRSKAAEVVLEAGEVIDAGEALLAELFTLGQSKPTLENTGLRSAPTRTISEKLVITEPTTIKNARIEALISTSAPLILEDCEVVGPLNHAPTRITPLISATSLTASVELRHCLVKPKVADPAVSGIMGHKIFSYRTVWTGGVDGIGYNRKAVDSYLKVHGSLITNLAYFNPDPYPSDKKSHSDCIQIHGDAIGIEVIGSTLAGFCDPTIGQGASVGTSTSAMMFSPIGSQMRDVLVDRNWIDGGSVSLNFSGWTSCTNAVVSNNRFGRRQRDGAAIIKQSVLPLQIVGNVYEDDGTPANGWKRG